MPPLCVDNVDILMILKQRQLWLHSCHSGLSMACSSEISRQKLLKNFQGSRIAAANHSNAQIVTNPTNGRADNGSAHTLCKLLLAAKLFHRNYECRKSQQHRLRHTVHTYERAREHVHSIKQTQRSAGSFKWCASSLARSRTFKYY